MGNKSSHRFFRFTALSPFEGGEGGCPTAFGYRVPRITINHWPLTINLSFRAKRRISFPLPCEIPHCVRNDKRRCSEWQRLLFALICAICEICVRTNPTPHKKKGRTDGSPLHGITINNWPLTINLSFRAKRRISSLYPARFLTAFGMTRGGVRNDKRGLFALICVHLRNLRSDKPDTTQKKGRTQMVRPYTA